MTTTIGDLQVLIRGDASSLTSALSSSVAGMGAVNVAAAATIGGVALIGAAAVSAAIDYESAFTKIEALSNASAEAVGEWKEEVLTLAGETAQAPQELADALFFLASAGLETSQVMEVLEASAQASAVGLGETTDIAKVTANALNAYAASGLEAAEVTDTLVAAVKAGSADPDEFAAALGRILPIASKAGVEFDQVTASLAGLSNIGLDVNEGVTAMRGVLGAMVAPGKQAAEALDSLGISTEDLRKVLSEGGLLAAMQLLEERSGGNLDVLRLLIPNIRALTGQLGLTGDNAEQVAAIFDQVANSSGALGEAFTTTQQEIAFQIDQIKAKLQVLLIELGDRLLPIVRVVTAAFSGLISTIGPLIPALVGIGTALAGLKLIHALSGPLVTFSNSLALLGTRVLQAGQHFNATRDGLGSFAVAMGKSRASVVGMLGSLVRIGGPIVALVAAFKVASNVMKSFNLNVEELSESTGVGVETLRAYAEELRSVAGADLVDKFGGTSEETAAFASVLGDASVALQELGLGVESTDKFLTAFKDTITNTTPAGIAEFQGRLQGTIGVIDGFGQALADGSMPLDSFLTQMETLGFTDLDSMVLARAALDEFGKTVQKNGRITSNFLSMTKEQLDEWSAEVTQDFADAIHETESFRETFKGTVKQFLHGLDEMARVAEREGENLLKLVRMEVPEEFINFLINQGPAAIDDYVHANKRGQQEALQDWRRTEAGIADVDKAIDILTRRNVNIRPKVDNRQALGAVQNLAAALAALVNHNWTVTVNGNAGIPPAADPRSGNSLPSGGGTVTRRKREASYLDRERFERDHAYSREYEGWR